MSYRRSETGLTECVKPSEVHPEVGHLEQVLHLFTVRVLDLDVRRQDTEDELKF